MNTPKHILILLYSCHNLLCTHYKMEVGPPELLLIFTPPENKTLLFVKLEINRKIIIFSSVLANTHKAKN